LSPTNFIESDVERVRHCLGYSGCSDEYSWCAATTWSNVMATHRMVAGRWCMVPATSATATHQRRVKTSSYHRIGQSR